MGAAAIHLVVLLALLPAASQQEVTCGTCRCAVFSVAGSEPLIEKTLSRNVSCDQAGAEECRQMCVTLATNARDHAPALICERLNMHVENLKVLVWTKSCDAVSWTFTGLESPSPICCHEGKATVCKTVGAVN